MTNCAVMAVLSGQVASLVSYSLRQAREGALAFRVRLTVRVGAGQPDGPVGFGCRLPGLSCSGLVTTPAEVAQDWPDVGGDARLGGDLPGADGDGGRAQGS